MPTFPFSSGEEEEEEEDCCCFAKIIQEEEIDKQPAKSRVVNPSSTVSKVVEEPTTPPSQRRHQNHHTTTQHLRCWIAPYYDGQSMMKSEVLRHFVGRQDAQSFTTQWSQVHQYSYAGEELQEVPTGLGSKTALFRGRTFQCDRDERCEAEVFVYCVNCRDGCDGNCPGGSERIVFVHCDHLCLCEFSLRSNDSVFVFEEQQSQTKKTNVIDDEWTEILEQRETDPCLRPKKEFVCHEYALLEKNVDSCFPGSGLGVITGAWRYRCVEPGCPATVIKFETYGFSETPPTPPDERRVSASMIANRLQRTEGLSFSYFCEGGEGAHCCQRGASNEMMAVEQHFEWRTKRSI